MTESHPIEFGKYTLLHKLATGGMAELYLAKMTGAEGFEKLIAIKKILPHLLAEKDFVDSFIAEAKLAAFLQHPNIVQIYDFGSMDGNYFIAMEYLSGRDMKVVINKSAQSGLPLGLNMALYITARVCSGLDYAHDLKDFYGNHLNIIHRDISPQNIFITHDGLVKIIDFGIAKAAGLNTTTQIGSIKGKIAYMSPEQASGQPIDYRSDIYAVGILLYEMVTHHRMFEGDTFEVFPRVREADFEPPENLVDGLPPNVARILHRALDKDPDMRYQSAGDMQADLEACMAELGDRPGAKGLTRFMGELFLDETIAERTALVSAITGAEKTAGNKVAESKAGVTEGGVAGGHVTGGTRGGMTNSGVSSINEKTEVLSEVYVPKPLKKKPLYPVMAAVGSLLVCIAAVFIFMSGKTPNDNGKATGLENKGGVSQGMEGRPDRPGGKSGAEIRSRANALFRDAMALMKTDPPKADSLLKKCVALDPENSKAWFRLGVLYSRKKAYPDAISFYKKAVRLDPGFTAAFFNLGYIYAIDGKYADAEKMYRRVVSLKPDFMDEALFNLAMVEVRLGKKSEGMKNLERALKINPENKAASAYLTRLKHNK